MKRILYITEYLAIVCLLSTYGCKTPDITEGNAASIDEALVSAFIQYEDYGLYNSNADPDYTLDLLKQEMVYNTKSMKFIIQDEDRAEVFSAALSPSGQDGFYSVVTESSIGDIAEGQFRMKEVKREGDRIWLWEANNKFGLVALYEN